MENLTGGTPPVRYLLCVVPCKLYFSGEERFFSIKLRYEGEKLVEKKIQLYYEK